MKLAKETIIILCDDVRTEVGNKLSIMGIYGNEIQFEAAPPLFLHNFCICVIMRGIRIAIPDIKFKLFTPKSEMIEMNLPPPENTEIGKDTNIVIHVSPLRIAAFGNAKVEITFGDIKTSITYKFKIAGKQNTITVLK